MELYFTDKIYRTLIKSSELSLYLSLPDLNELKKNVWKLYFQNIAFLPKVFFMSDSQLMLKVGIDRDVGDVLRRLMSSIGG